MKTIIAAVIALGMTGPAVSWELTGSGYNSIGIDPVTLECIVDGKVTSRYTDRNGNTFISCTGGPSTGRMIESSLGRSSGSSTPIVVVEDDKDWKGKGPKWGKKKHHGHHFGPGKGKGKGKGKGPHGGPPSHTPPAQTPPGNGGACPPQSNAPHCR
ncbi:hypothetical protein [Pelagibacterium montanilacus]|uniref:hypothetical protein n=1 Tax=Pelagibacterium montanilacus TaxID=2185280 RepID=UPI000F8CB31A|nr:hypothetical protein [Pelagibacterium montanilacus]